MVRKTDVGGLLNSTDHNLRFCKMTPFRNAGVYVSRTCKKLECLLF